MTTAVCYVIHDYILPQYCRPKSLPKQKYNSFDNIAVSLVHSTVTGIGKVPIWSTKKRLNISFLRIVVPYHIDPIIDRLSGCINN